MKMQYLKLLCLSFVIFVSCTQENPDVRTPGGNIAIKKSLSAGDLTIFTQSKSAYDLPSNILEGVMLDRFNKGDALYELGRVSSPHKLDGIAGGLGPLYCGFSCASCHEGSGRTKSTLFTHGGTGVGFSSFLTFLKSKNGGYFPEYGRVLHDHATGDAVPEGKLKVTYSEKTYSFHDGEDYKLITPKYKITDWYATVIPDDELVLSVRTPLRHVGMGLMMAVDQNEILALASMQYPEFNISGEINWVYERNQRYMGLSGHKAQHADLTIELGFSSDMGVTNTRYPDEVGKEQTQSPSSHDFGIEITTEDMSNVEVYMMSLGVPARRNVNDPTIVRGEQMFNKAKCQLCHTPTLHTSPKPIKLIDGTEMPHLANRTIHPYSDYLIHDMGPELGDEYDQYNASGDEWRTTPLWGIGLQERVSGHTHFLHDGRARNYVEAIMWHGGEGAVSREIFSNMPKSDRDALVEFLKSL